jgi:hypothetical protein
MIVASFYFFKFKFGQVLASAISFQSMHSCSWVTFCKIYQFFPKKEKEKKRENRLIKMKVEGSSSKVHIWN